MKKSFLRCHIKARVDTPAGYIASGRMHYYIRDYQGNVRQVTDSDGNVEQDNHYYPYGMLMGESSDILATARSGRNPLLPSTANPYLYGGKEYMTTGGANLLDFTARTYDPSILLFHTPDPLRDKYLPVHSYLYCGANPINRIDPTGCGDFWDGGNHLGGDGKKDGKVYVLKTKEQTFGPEGESVSGAGLSKDERTATEDFISKNDGNSDAFTDGCIAYANCIEIEGSPTLRKEMVGCVSGDNGKGGRRDSNNREYGGYIKDGEAKSVPPGPVCNLGTDTSASIILPNNNCPTFHSHPSGEIRVVVEEPGTVSSNTWGPRTLPKNYIQSPSPEDIKMSGDTTNYVFGKGDNKVYIYTSSGVQAVVIIRDFLSYGINESNK